MNGGEPSGLASSEPNEAPVPKKLPLIEESELWRSCHARNLDHVELPDKLCHVRSPFIQIRKMFPHTLMRHTGASEPTRHDPEHLRQLRQSDGLVQATDEMCTAHVLIVGQGQGLCSHWASLWIFDTGEVWCVELSAIDPETGERWGENRCHVELLRMPWEEKEDGLVESQKSHNMDRMEQVQRTIDFIWPNRRTGLNKILNCIDCLLSVQESKEEIQLAMDNIWCMMSRDDVQQMAEMLLLTSVESTLAAWRPQYRRLMKAEIEQIESVLKVIWPIPSECKLEEAKARLLQGINDAESREECKRQIEQTMDAFWPMLTLFDGHVREMVETLFLQLIDGVDCSEDLSNRIQQVMDCIWRPILCGEDNFYTPPDLFLKRQLERSIGAAQPGEERRRQVQSAMNNAWGKMNSLPAVTTLEELLLEYFLSTNATEDSRQKIQKGIGRIWRSILAATNDAVERHASTMKSIKEARSREKVRELIQADLKSAWPALPPGRDCHRSEIVQRLLFSLLDRTECCRAELRRNLWTLTESFSMAEQSILKYMNAFDYDILGAHEPIKVAEISPAKLLWTADTNPLIGSSYDLLFNNCQLYILHLLYTQYGLKDVCLPWNIGALVAGPLMLAVEVLYIGVFSLLTQHGKHLLASCFGIVWIAIELSISCAYLKTCKRPSQSLQTANCALQPEVLAFVFGVAGSAGIVLRDASLSSSMLPLLSFLWDLILVFQAATTNMVARDPLLIVLNLGMTSLSAFVVCFWQWQLGWPVQDVFLVSTAIIGLLGVIGSIWTLCTRLDSLLLLKTAAMLLLVCCVLSFCILGWMHGIAPAVQVLFLFQDHESNDTISAHKEASTTQSHADSFVADCPHGRYKRDTRSCECDENWATADITDTVDFLEGVCELYQCIDDATCKDILNIDDFDVSCPIPKWNCYCGWKYAMMNNFHGYEVSKPQNGNSTGAKCMGVMHTLSVWSTLTVLWLMQQTLWMVLMLTLVCLPIGKMRIRCDHHVPCLSTELRWLCGRPPSCHGACPFREKYGWDDLMDEFAWSSYVVSVGGWVLAFLSILYVMALFVWSIVLWAMVLVLLVVAGLCMLCEGGAGHCDPGVGLPNVDGMMYWSGPLPIDRWYYCDCSGLAGTPEDSCCGCSCRGCCFRIAWLIRRFPRMPENMWGGGLGYVLGTHSRSQRRCQNCDPLIDCLGMLWMRSGDLHEDDNWRMNVLQFLYYTRYTAELPYHDSVESTGGDRFRVGRASGEFINRHFNDSDGCTPSSFKDYMNNKCWICHTGNSEWDLWVVCRHMFCKRCSEEMLRRRMPCPLCRCSSLQFLRGNGIDFETVIDFRTRD